LQQLHLIFKLKGELIMLEKAKAKLQDEMDKAKNNHYVQVVGDYLLQYLDKNPGTAESILAKEKTIAKSLDAMRNDASKKKVGNCAMFTPDEGFAIVMKYYGIKDASTPAKVDYAVGNYRPQPAAPAPKPAADFDIDLEDLLV
jgi:hypothetical protein